MAPLKSVAGVARERLSMAFGIRLNLVIGTHMCTRFLAKTMGYKDERQSMITIVLWVSMSVSLIGVSIVALSGKLRIISVVAIRGRHSGSTAYPEGGPKRDSDRWLCPMLIVLVFCLPLVLIEIFFVGAPMGPPTLVTHLIVEFMGSTARGWRTQAMPSKPHRAAVPAVTGLTLAAILGQTGMENAPLPRGADGTRGRAVRSRSGWSRRHGSICQRQASLAAGNCVMEKIATGPECTAAAARGTRPPLPR